MQQVDVLIIGGGPGGYETAALAASRGLHVVLFEKSHPGGTCLNRGCIPTKCLCATAERLLEIRQSGKFGIICNDATIDFKAVKARMQEVVRQLRDDVGLALSDVTVVHAEAKLLSDGTVEVDGETYKANKVLIATGSAPARLDIPGASQTLTSDDVLRMDAIPESIVVIGGGVIGVEFASCFAAFGSDVTILEYAPEILPGFDADIAKRLRSQLSRRGINIITKAQATAIENDGTVVKYIHKDKEKQIAADVVVMAVGRRPVLPEGIDGAGIELTRRGFINTDANFATSKPGVYAIGDVNGRCMLAHAASAQGRAVLGIPSVRLDLIPSVVFTSPQCAYVGIGDVDDSLYKAVKVPYGANGMALASGYTDGFVKLIAERSSGRIVGCHVIGAHAADIVAEATVAIANRMTVSDLSESIVHAHPTISELLARAAANLY